MSNYDRHLWLDSVKIKGSGLDVSCASHKEQENVAGKTSGADKSYQGTRLFRFNVSLRIKFKNEKNLEALRKLYQAVDDKGNPRIFKIRNITAQVLGVTHVEFSDNLNVKQNQKLDLWEISFILEDANPIQKKKEDKVGSIEKQSTKQPEGTSSTAINAGMLNTTNQDLIARLAVNRDNATKVNA